MGLRWTSLRNVPLTTLMQGFYCNLSDLGFTKVIMGDLELGKSSIFHNVTILFHHPISFRTLFCLSKPFFKFENQVFFSRSKVIEIE
jgi:hypothetical protein